MVALTAMRGLGPLLALAALFSLLIQAAADDALPECPDRVVLFQFNSIRWQGNESESIRGDSFVMQVVATTTCDDGFPNDTFPLLDVTMVYTSASQTLVNVVGSGSIASPNLTFYFPIDINTINFTTPVYYAVSATFDSKTSTAIGWERDTVKKWQPIQMNGAAKVALEVMPGVIEAHYLQPLNLTRLSKIGNLDLVDCTLAKDEEGACYFMTAGQGDKDVCINQTLSETDTGGVLLVCDDTVQFVTVSETTNLDSVYLHYPDGVVEVIQTNKATTLELYRYNGTYEACDESTRCHLASFVPSNENYTIRMVELDRMSPTSSREVFVQDFNVTTLGISSDTAQVSWDSGTGGEFNVTISPAPDKKFSGRVVNCTKASCDFFFIGLEEDWTSYNTTVRSVIGDSFTSEIVTSLAAPPIITTSSMEITTLHHHYAVDKDVIIQTEACFEYDSNELSSARLLLIDFTGLAVQSTERGLNDNNNNTYCFESVVVPGEFNTSGQTRILVNYENGEKETFSTQTDIFLFTPDFQQVSNTSARAIWKNLNSAEFFTSRVPGHVSHAEQQLECSYTGDRCYYYVTEDEAGSGEFSLLEKSDNLNQSSTVQLNMIEITKEIVIVTPFSIRQGDDLLQVCFGAVPNVHHYELGVELLGELVSSNQDAQTEIVSGKTCAVSSKPVTLGAYEEVWAVVVAYDLDGEILSAGENSYEETFLSPNRFVLAVTSGSESPVSLKASWYILDDTNSFTIYTVNLVDSEGGTLTKPVIISTTTVEFPIENEGPYSVCVSVTTPSGTESEQTCSDIIRVKFSPDSSDPAPMVTNVDHFFTSDDKLKLTWERPDNASALLVSWKNAPTRHTARNRRSLRSIETARNPVFNTRKTVVQQSSPRGSDVAAFSLRKADVPLPQARSLQGINDQIRRVVLPDITGEGFTLVPASQSFLDIPLPKDTSWHICVSAVNNHQAGTDFCLNATLPGDSDTVVSPPTGLSFNGSVLSWDEPSIALVEGDSYTYYIEFDWGSESLSLTTPNVSLPVMGLVDAGEWRVNVHSSISTKRLSEGLTKTIVVNGIKVTYEQTGSRDVTLSWEETSDSDEDHELTYKVTIVELASVNTTCSRAKGCSVTFVDVAADESQTLTVTIQNNQGMEGELQIYFLDIASVDVDQMKRNLNANGSVTVTWACLDDNVSFYNISLVDKNDVVLSNRHKTVPCSYTFADSMTILQDDSVLIQACLNSPGVERCGDPQRISLGPDVPPGPTTDSSNVLVIVLSSVAAGLLLILMVAGIVYKLRSDRAKRAAGKDTSNGGGSVRSLKVDSGSQHSVEPPAGQPTTELQTNAQNSSQTPVQRQTPVQYRSAAPVSQAQPSNRPIELSINASLNHAAARAPISSVNPNVRYDGSAQTNASGNVGSQRLPQVGNPPPPQRYSNPNVRAAGPLRMHVPAGQPRMNNVPSGPPNFSGQPRNLTQGARMNRPLNSQPVEVRGRFSGAPIMTRPSQMSPTRAPAPRPTGLQMTASPTRYPPPGQRFAPGPSSPTRVQAPPSGLRPIPRVGGGGGYVDMSPSAPGLRPTRSDGRQFSPERAVRQPQPQNPRGPVRNNPDTNRPNYNERIF